MDRGNCPGGLRLLVSRKPTVSANPAASAGRTKAEVGEHRENQSDPQVHPACVRARCHPRWKTNHSPRISAQKRFTRSEVADLERTIAELHGVLRELAASTLQLLKISPPRKPADAVIVGEIVKRARKVLAHLEPPSR